jgi:hypothetical protein
MATVIKTDEVSATSKRELTTVEMHIGALLRGDTTTHADAILAILERAHMRADRAEARVRELQERGVVLVGERKAWESLALDHSRRIAQLEGQLRQLSK